MLVSVSFSLILVCGAILRIAHLGEHRFHVDEALFSSYGLAIASGLDPLLQNEAVDKPPLFFYILALSFKVFGESETAAAIPSIVASLGAIALVFSLCRRLYDAPTALVAAALMAVSPFNVAYAYTAFIDPLMVATALLAMWSAERCRFLGAGFFAGLLPALKVQGVLFWPAVGLMGLFGLVAARARPLRWALSLGLALVGTAVPLLLLAYWSSLRPQQVPFLDLASQHNPLVPADPATYAVRAADWWKSSLRYLTGSPLANRVFAVGIPLLLLWDLVALALRWGSRRAALADWGLAAYAAFFLGWHTYFELPAWDRYMLGIVPFGLIIAARATVLPWQALKALLPAQTTSPHAAWAVGTLVALFLGVSSLMPLQAGLRESYPLGWAGVGGPVSYQGIDSVAGYIKGNVPPGSVVFDYQSLSWHYKYYLFGLPLKVIWFDDELIGAFQYRALTEFGEVPKYIVLPDWLDGRERRQKLQGDKLRLEPVHRAFRKDGSASFTVYRVEPAP